MINQATIDFSIQHRNDDPKSLALRAKPAADVDLAAALKQIAGWQAARRKLPSWAEREGIVYPHHLAMEQCSSEHTARYKAQVAARILGEGTKGGTMYDLTGGLGVDFSFLSPLFDRAVYVEQQQELAEVARHNFGVLGLENVEVRCGTAAETLHSIDHATMIFIDPARRDANGGRTFALSDCTPDVLSMKEELLRKTDMLMIKLSPMLDWHEVARQLGCVREMHIISVRNECKEVMPVVVAASRRGDDRDVADVAAQGIKVFCINDGQDFSFVPSVCAGGSDVMGKRVNEEGGNGEEGGFLLVPNSSIMKAGCFDEVAMRYGIRQVSANSHLFVSSHFIDDFPGRAFKISAISSMNKRELRQTLGSITKANIAVRNFPMTAEQLRKRLRLSDGGEHYIFATTNSGGEHVLFVCKKA
ncbi:MAG: SAM-dependent methyltransferase [Prevotella sp.]|uniref:THUMP-like domain-containing protein n=1 Tax=Prevotella sp. TaxID=59823 RepID=UPI002A269F70|nr:SAM-dependent methyltransferase [Prevotella sp.]MDD7318432.1 SAM-dependent methyltransferase [Prevotellaceae bacterium]MDY4020217.1 SAM-dependent methyltransferase [Prevotella sp.]